MTDTFRPPHVRRLLEQLPGGEARVVREFMDTFQAALVEGGVPAVGRTQQAGLGGSLGPPSASAAQLGMWSG